MQRLPRIANNFPRCPGVSETDTKETVKSGTPSVSDLSDAEALRILFSDAFKRTKTGQTIPYSYNVDNFPDLYKLFLDLEQKHGTSSESLGDWLGFGNINRLAGEISTSGIINSGNGFFNNFNSLSSHINTFINNLPEASRNILQEKTFLHTTLSFIQLYRADDAPGRLLALSHMLVAVGLTPSFAMSLASSAFEALSQEQVINGEQGEHAQFIGEFTTVLTTITMVVGGMILQKMPSSETLKSCIASFKSLGELGRAAQGSGILFGYIESAVKHCVSFFVKELDPNIELSLKLQSIREEMGQWSQDISTLDTDYYRNRMTFDDAIRLRVLKLRDKADEFHRVVCECPKVDQGVVASFRVLYTKVLEYAQIVARANGDSHFRVDPFHTHLWGPAGVGKTFAMLQFSDLLADAEGVPRYNRHFDRNAEADDFWSGYEHQNDVRWDDPLQWRNTNCKVSSAIEIAKAKTNTTYRLNMAQAQDKGRCFTSKWIYSCDNAGWIVPKEISDPMMWYRRYDAKFYVFPKERYIKTCDSAKLNVTIDWEIVKQEGLYGTLEHLEFFLCDPRVPNSINKQPMTWRQAVAYCRTTAVLHFERQEAMRAKLTSGENHVEAPLGNEDLDARAAAFLQAFAEHERSQAQEDFQDASSEPVHAQFIGETREDTIRKNWLGTVERLFSGDDSPAELHVPCPMWLCNATVELIKDHCPVHEEPHEIHWLLGEYYAYFMHPNSIVTFAQVRSTIIMLGRLAENQGHSPLLDEWMLPSETGDSVAYTIDRESGNADSTTWRITNEIGEFMRMISESNLSDHGIFWDVVEAQNEGGVFMTWPVDYWSKCFVTAHEVDGEMKTTLMVNPIEGDAEFEVFRQWLTLERYLMFVQSRRKLKELPSTHVSFMEKLAGWLVNLGQQMELFIIRHPLICNILALGQWLLVFWASYKITGWLLEPPRKPDQGEAENSSGDFKTMKKKKQTKKVVCEVGGNIITTRRRKFDAEAEGTTDPNALEISKMLIHRSVELSHTKREWKMHGVAVGGKNILLPHHFMFGVEDGDIINIQSAFGTFNIAFHYDDCSRYTDKDLMLWHVGGAFPGLKKIQHHFVQNEDLSYLKRVDAELVMRNSDKSGNLRIPLEALMGDAQNSNCDYTVGPQEYSVMSGWTYRANTTKGYCGAILLCYNPRLQHKVIGFHVAGSNSNRFGYSECITANQLGELFTSVEAKHGLTDFREDIPVEAQVIGDATNASFVLEGNYALVGTVPPSRMVIPPRRSDIIPSEIHDLVREHVTEPAVLLPSDPRSPVEGSPLVLNLNKYAGEPIPFPREKLTQVRDWVSHECRKMRRRCPRKPQALSLQESIDGIPLLEYYDPLDKNTSPGYPWVLERPTGTKGKHFLFEEDGTPCKRLKLAFDNRMIALACGKSTFTLAVNTLKDERVKLEKVLLKKTRLFDNLPVDFTMASRALTMDFVAAMYASRIDFPSAVGIDPYSPEWTTLKEELSKISSKLVAGDYSKFDGSLHGDIIYMCADIITDWYGDGKYLERRALFETIIHTDMINMNVVYRKNHGNPSGVSLTVVINNLANMFYMGLAWLLLAERNDPLYQTMAAFIANTKLVCYGDDNIMSVSERVQSWYNMHTISGVLQEYGITYTPPDKSDSSDLFYSWDDVTFLKNGFRPDEVYPHRYHATLSHDTIFELTNWVRICDDPRAAMDENLKTALKFAYHHGKEFYDSLYSKINTAREFVGLNPIYDEYVFHQAEWVSSFY